MGGTASPSEAEVPIVTPEEQSGMKDFLEVYEAHYDEIYRRLLRSVEKLPGLHSLVKRTPPEQQDEQNRISRHLMRDAILNGNWKPLLANQRAQGEMYAGMGIQFHEWFDLVSDFEKLLVPRLVEKHGTANGRLSSSLLGLSRYLHIAMAGIGEAYLRTKEERILQQQQAIQELSTPVLQVKERMLLLPIIGVLDTARARQLTRQLLKEIRATRAKVVVLDITGVPAVDSKVANHLLQTVAAVRLMGASAIITGIAAEVAQALVVLGVNLGDLRTAGDLQGGLEEAERILTEGAK
ncbi:MAG TPA: STAS domain-containing protein [Myxococcaceae bacterium]|nr:STAS domain-containing protein [Myxococcaceae bacterium]